MRIAMKTVPRSQVTGKLAPGRISYRDLHLDPLSRTGFSTTCDLAGAYRTLTAQPFNYKLVYTLSHQHSLGKYTELAVVGGPHDARSSCATTATARTRASRSTRPPISARWAPPVFGSPAASPTARGRGQVGHRRSGDVRHGPPGHHDFAWDGDVGEGTGTKLGVAGDGEVRYQGPCGMLPFAWSFDKPGGPPR